MHESQLVSQYILYTCMSLHSVTVYNYFIQTVRLLMIICTLGTSVLVTLYKL